MARWDLGRAESAPGKEHRAPTGPCLLVTGRHREISFSNWFSQRELFCIQVFQGVPFFLSVLAEGAFFHLARSYLLGEQDPWLERVGGASDLGPSEEGASLRSAPPGGLRCSLPLRLLGLEHPIE